jgi:DeoR/GlpR family transcriptional regulator of sugar metabolism
MLKDVRLKSIIELLGTVGAISISELADRMDASMMTIRRDLDILEKEGVVRKMHGGAVLVSSDAVQPTYHERVAELQTEKNRIGKAAAAMIKPGSIALFDAGTTPLAVVGHIPADLEFTAITTGLMTATELCGKTSANVICIGGNIHPTSYSAVNYFAIDMLSHFHADIAFISTKSVSLPEGLFETQLPLIEIKRKLVSVSDKVVLLADSRKFSTKALCMSIPMEDIDVVITDDKVSSEVVEQMKGLGKEMVVV